MIANDAATLPASLHGRHLPSGDDIEVRLAGRRSLAADDVAQFAAIVFGAGDFRTRTEDRPPPPSLTAGDRLVLGPLTATVERLLDHKRLAALRFTGTPAAIWAGLASHGRPIQYAHIAMALALWDVWTPIAGPPVGISSTGDDALDRRLPFDEPYCIPPATAVAIGRTRARGRRIVAIGTTVVRALENAASRDGRVPAGEGTATQRIDAASDLRVVDAILSGAHHPGTSHYELLRAFTDDATLRRVDDELEAQLYRTHEFGDSVFIARKRVSEPTRLSLGISQRHSALQRSP